MQAEVYARTCLLALHVGTGSEALEMYVSADPVVKLVLLDVTLPDMSGHEVSAAAQDCSSF